MEMRSISTGIAMGKNVSVRKKTGIVSEIYYFTFYCSFAELEVTPSQCLVGNSISG